MMTCGQSYSCGCCNGVWPTTPAEVYNRPGLDALQCRIGEHGSFFATMKSRLASSDFPALVGLGARTTDDFAIALLDGWATIADTLTFYQERLANEGYLRTATERRSVLELARLIGYNPRPGVAATVYLAFEIDKNAEKPVEISVGSRVQSLPGPGELPQTFETMDKLLARKEWNVITPRLERPNSVFRMTLGTDKAPGGRVYLKGTSTGLKANDAILIQILDSNPAMYRVTDVSADSSADRTTVRFENWDGSEFEVPQDTVIQRALVAFTLTTASQYPTNSLSMQVLVELGQFLAWLYEKASADPLEPGVDQVLERGGERTDLIALLLEAVETLRAAAIFAGPDESLLRALDEAVKTFSGFSGVIEEVTGLAGGGIVGAETDALAQRLAAILKSTPEPALKEDARASALFRQILGRLAASRSVPPRNTQSLERNSADHFDRNADVGSQAVAALEPAVASELTAATRNAKVSPDVPIRVYAMRQKSLLFGSTAPRKVTSVSQDGVATTVEWSDADIYSAELGYAIHLDSPQDKIRNGTWLALDYSAVGYSLGNITRPDALVDGRFLIARAGSVTSKMARAEYNLTGQTTRIYLVTPDGKSSLQWFTYHFPTGEKAQSPTPAFQLIRGIVVYAESEELQLALEPIDEAICGGDQWIETDNLYTGLQSGRWLVVSGERADVPGTDGVRGSELVMLDSVRNYVQKLDVSAFGRAGSKIALKMPSYEPGEKLHTFLKFATPLAYCYKRSTVTINANVVRASHGETRTETLGSGDAANALQTFTLRQPPLTYVPANEPDGISSTLRAYVNGVEWHEAAAMIALGPTDRGFVTRTDNDGNTFLVFGNGQHGARLPTGVENIKTIYRSGIGKAGNVKSGQISQLLSRPLGVKGVLNPLEASGGADRETRDQARKNAPLQVMALDRLVGTRDYADLTRTFAGIAKATSARVFSEGGDAVYVTVAGVDDMPIPETGDLYANLISALRTYGDPSLPVRVQMRELLMLVMSARIAIDSDYLWEDVADRVQAALLDRFSFERQELGQSVALSQVLAFIQGQRGVRYVDVEALGAVSQVTSEGDLRSPQEISSALRLVISIAANEGRPDAFVPVAAIRSTSKGVLPAQLAFLVPSLVTETLLLSRIED